MEKKTIKTPKTRRTRHKRHGRSRRIGQRRTGDRLLTRDPSPAQNAGSGFRLRTPASLTPTKRLKFPLEIQPGALSPPGQPSGLAECKLLASGCWLLARAVDF